MVVRMIALLLLAATLTACQTAQSISNIPSQRRSRSVDPMTPGSRTTDPPSNVERGCIQDFQRQGFERMAKPPE